MRRALAIFGAALLLFGSVQGVAANKAIKESDHSRDAGCFDFPTPLGIADFSGTVSDTFGADAFLTVWSGEPGNSEIVLDRDPDQAASVVFGATSVSMTIPLVPSGVATVTGSLVPADTFSSDDRFRDGNSWNCATTTGTEYAFTATVILPGVSGPIDVDPAACTGSDTTFTLFQTDPHATVKNSEVRNGECFVTNADGDSLDLFLGLDPTEYFISGTVTDTSGSTVGVNGAGTPGADGAATFETSEYDPVTFESLPTTGVATVTAVSTGELYTYTLHGSGGFERIRGDLLDVGGLLETSLGSFSLETCAAIDGSSKRVGNTAGGPKPGTKRPANDLPSGAIPVKAGYKAVLATRGAQVQSETGFPCMQFTEFDGSVSEVPVVNTVWFKLAGTGGTVTIDTAGSDFDTVAAAYVGGPDSASTVACVDDVPLQPLGRTLQSAITFTAESGKSYWIQVGGLDEFPIPFDDGVHWVGYGNLKVAVR